MWAGPRAGQYSDWLRKYGTKRKDGRETKKNSGVVQAVYPMPVLSL